MCIALGRGLAALVGVRGALRPSEVGPSAATGLALCAITYGWMTTSGATARGVLLATGVLALVFAALAAARGRLAVYRLRGGPAAWSGLAAAITLALVASLLPVLASGGFAIANDSFIYCALSEWLQTSALDHVPQWDPASPLTHFPSLWQGGVPGAELREAPSAGAAYVLALVQAARGGSVSLLAFPGTSALGILTLTALVFSLARSSLRLPTRWAAVCALAFAALPHPLLWAHHRGFLQQTLGLPVVFAIVALASSAGGRGGRCTGRAMHLGVLLAGAASLYLVAVPIALAALAAAAARAALRSGAGRCRPWGCAAAVLLTAVALAPRDLTIGLSRIPGLTGIVAGWQVPWTPLDRLGYAFGLGAPGSAAWVDFAVLRWGGLLLCGLATAGVPSLRKPRAWPLGAVVSLLAALGLYFGVLASDPWSGARGHSWNLTRVTQWAFPVALLLAVAGLRLAVRRLAWLVLPPLVALGLAAGAGSWEEARDLGLTMRRIFVSERPLRELAKLRESVLALPEGQLLLVGRAANRGVWLGAYVCLIAWPRGVVGLWEGSGGVGSTVANEAYAALLPRAGQPGVIALGAGLQEGESDAFRALGSGFGVLEDPQRPAVLYVLRPRRLARTDADRAVPVDAGRTWLSIWSPRDLPLELEGELAPREHRVGSLPGTATARLMWTLLPGDPPALKRSLSRSRTDVVAAAAGPVRLPFRASPGLTTLVLSIDGLPEQWLLHGVRIAPPPAR